MSLKNRINHPNLSEEVYSILAERIINRKIHPGVRLVEEELAKDFDISRTPIREALNRLAQDGLVELIPRKGAQVSQLKARDVEAIKDQKVTDFAYVCANKAVILLPSNLVLKKISEDALSKSPKTGSLVHYHIKFETENGIKWILRSGIREDVEKYYHRI